MDFKNLYAPKDFKNGWNETIKVQEYHSDKNAVNSSSLKKMIKSPLAFHESFYGEKDEPSEAMKFGTLAHLALLQGDLFREKYIVMPEFESRTADGKVSESKNTKFYKDQVIEWKKTVPADALVVTSEERKNLFGIIDSILKHKIASNLLKNGKPEICGYWVDPETGIKCRMQADFLTFDGETLVDVKTTQDCSWPEFRRSVESYEYSFQMEMYAEGIKQITGKRPSNIVWLAVESKPPFEVRAYLMSPHYEVIGAYNFKKAIRRLKDCINSGDFSGEQKEIEMAEPSGWHIKKYEEQNAFENI